MKQIITFILGISVGIIFTITHNHKYIRNTKQIIHLQDSMIKELSNVLWFEYNYDLPEFDGDYNEIVDSLKHDIQL
jgi:hypothetical protein